MLAAQDIPSGESLDERVERITSELMWRRADVIDEGRWSLFRCLTQTFDTLEAWDQPERVRLAGLLNGAYSARGAVKTTLFDRSERALLEELVGPEAERLIALSCATTREDLLAALDSAGELAPSSLTFRTGTGESVIVTPRELGDMMVIHLARDAQQARPDGSPERRLAGAARLAFHASRYADVPPPVFDGGTARLSDEDETKLIDAYARVLEAVLGSHDAAVSALAAAAERAPWVSEPFVWLGLFALASGDGAAAAAYGARATRLLNGWNTSWDQRLSGLQWLGLASYLESVEALEGAELDFLVRHTRAVMASAARPDGVYAQFEALGALGEPQISALGIDPEPDAEVSAAEADWSEFDILPTRFAQYAAGLRENADRPLMGFYPGVAGRPWWDPNEFALVSDLEAMADQIITEYSALESAHFVPPADHFNRTGSWSVCSLFERGKKREELAARCPVTIATIEKHLAVPDLSGAMYFARIPGGGKSARRRGSTNVRLRCHLGLKANGAAGITVDELPEKWRNRRCLVFDDSFEHEEWNRGDSECAVLVVDLWHPDLTADELRLLTGLNRTIAANADALHRHWLAGERSRAETVSVSS